MRSTFLVLLLFTVGGYGQVKRPQPVGVKPTFARSEQAVVVTTDDWASIHGTARLFERETPTARWKPVGESFLVVVGRGGLGTTTEDDWKSDATSQLFNLKREGDGRSPAGRFPLTTAFGTTDSPEGMRLPYTKLGEFTECVDDTASAHYNKIVDRMHVGNYDWKSSEKMFEIRPEYDVGVVVAYNSYPPVKGGGSCIFLHIWKNGVTPTSGCTAMERSDLERVLAWLDPAKTPYLIQLPTEEYSRYQKKWKLPKIN